MSLFGFGLAAVSAYGACSSSDSGGSQLQSAGGSITGSSATGGKGGSSGTSTGSGGSAGTISVTGGTGPGSGGSGSNIDACAAVHNTAQPTPVDLFIMLDQSTSMAETAGNGQTKWDAVVAAIKAFLAAPQATGIGVGIQYFGLADPSPCPATCTSGCSLIATPNACNPSCPVAQYATPDVPINPLPNVAPFISGSLDKHFPTSLTPTSSALQGALQYGQTWATANPTRTTIVVLATDGYPTECDPLSPTDIAVFAANALAGTPKVYTFVIGIGSTSAVWNLNSIAAGGGTRQAFIVDPASPTIVQDFTNALLGVATAPLSCEYPIPKPDGGTIDPGKVNVEFTPLTGAPVDLYGVKTAQDCSKVANGWYYDNPTAPTKILICPSTCNSFGAGTLDILLGCATTPPPA